MLLPFEGGLPTRFATGEENLGETAVQITVDLTEEQTEQLKQLAESLGVDPTALARAAFADLLSCPTDDFQRAAAHVLEKNEELYRRLS